jgi:Lrp/AsnC family leucine-responsive transcriptional regulator
MNSKSCNPGELDSIDRQILRTLQTDARKSINELAKEIEMSPTAVRTRITRLEGFENGKYTGIIRGYFTILDCSRIGYREALLAQLRINPAQNLDSVKKEIDKDADIKLAYMTTGDFPILVMGKCIDHQKTMLLIERLRKLPGVEDVKTQMILERIKENWVVDIPEAP